MANYASMTTEELKQLQIQQYEKLQTLQVESFEYQAVVDVMADIDNALAARGIVIDDEDDLE